jgi:hypothetical protein
MPVSWWPFWPHARFSSVRHRFSPNTIFLPLSRILRKGYTTHAFMPTGLTITVGFMLGASITSRFATAWLRTAHAIVSSPTADIGGQTSMRLASPNILLIAFEAGSFPDLPATCGAKSTILIREITLTGWIVGCGDYQNYFLLPL